MGRSCRGRRFGMKIFRKGAKADHGVRSVELKRPTVRWNPTHDTFDVNFSGPANDFATNSRHNYTLRWEPPELASILNQLADQALSMDADEFKGTFAGSLPAILRLQLLASGVRLAA
jgi:hypothetical protein